MPRVWRRSVYLTALCFSRICLLVCIEFDPCMCLVAFLDSDPCLSVRLHGVCCMSLCLCVRPPCIDRMSVCLSVRVPKVCWVLVYLESVCLTDCITLSVFQSMYSLLYVWLPFCLSASPHIVWGISVWLSVCLCVGLPWVCSLLSFCLPAIFSTYLAYSTHSHWSYLFHVFLHLFRFKIQHEPTSTRKVHSITSNTLKSLITIKLLM